jgi:hypothetical protein
MAAGATEFIDNVTADAFIPEIWSPLAIVAREAQLVFAKLVDRKFEEGLTYGDTIHVPSIGDLNAREKVISTSSTESAGTSNSAITYETVTETNTNIVIDQHKYAAIAIESVTQTQTNRDLLASYAGKLGYALGKDVDGTLAGLVDDIGSPTVAGSTVAHFLGTLGVENTYDDYLTAIRLLDDANVAAESRYFVISPKAEVGLMKSDIFTNNDYSMLHGEGRQTALDHAYCASFLNIPIYKTTQVEGNNSDGHDNTLFQKEAWALVMQMTPKMHSMYDIDYLTDKIAIEQLYGTKEMREDHAVWIKGA